MWSFIIAESAIFTIFVVAYLFYVGKSLSGPTPRDVLEVPIFYTICLLSSSVTIHLAGRRPRAQRVEGLWRAVANHHCAWSHLLVRHRGRVAPPDLRTRPDDFHESVRHDVYSLVGLHAFHVTLGLVLLTTVFVVGLAAGARTQSKRINVLSLYWHFVDVVWIVVFTVVYVIGR